ncbi:hypothetical protein [Agrobacterium sp. T29]|uniref:hypothetical protein n=1 Tax=Agrobacterium sp. T29 TaxID=2580515 RepID=UPI00115CD787|nr:hypothetical protein [Agrobacterium sp. T29]
MIDADEVSVWLATGVLRSGGHEIEAMSLEAIAADAEEGGLGKALDEAQRSEQRGGALGLEIVGALIVPVLLEAARQFWAAYQKEFTERAGKSAAEATLAQFKKWFGNAAEEEKRVAAEKLAQSIRAVGKQRKLKPLDIEALVAATAPKQLEKALAT